VSEVSRQTDPSRIGRKSRTQQGYVLVFVGREHHLANANGYAYEHRLVMENKIGRRLRPGEIVHHVNHVKHDNSEDNLELQPSRWHHNAEHRKLETRRQAPGQANERIECACGCKETLWRFNTQHIEVRFISGHNGKLNKKYRAPKPRQGEYNRRKTHCHAGHEFTDANTRVSRGRRVCKACHRIKEYERNHHGES